MPLSRSPRMDRRRRVLREGMAAHQDESSLEKSQPPRSGRSSSTNKDIEDEVARRERGVAYSNSVRTTCQQRVVQFIPVRRISLTGAVLASTLIPLVLISLHYLVFVNGYLPWYRHPMSALLDASSTRGLAAWLSSQLWLLCLASTVLTFRLRRHKLDDYEGEYRLWFWLVFTCIIGSIDSTTHITELFGAALDRWTQVHIGWTGPAVMQATLATLVGLLGLRLCTELKVVRSSLVLWLAGLACWAISAALGQPLLKLDLTIQVRVWLRASLWLGGLTCIWLCSLLFLRAVFMEAQQRFIQRSRIAFRTGPSWKERMSGAMPHIPFLNRNREELTDELEPERKPTRTKKSKTTPTTAAGESADTDPSNSSDSTSKSRWGLPKFSFKRSQSTDTASATSIASKSGSNKRLSDEDEDEEYQDSAPQRSAPPAPRSRAAEEAEIENEYAKRSGWFGRRTANPNSDNSTATSTAKKAATKPRRDQDDDSSDAEASTTRRFRDRFTWKRKSKTGAAESTKTSNQSGQDGEAAPKKRLMQLPRPSLPKLPKFSIPKPRLPKLKLPSFRLPPPTDGGEDGATTEGRPVTGNRPLPSTSNPNASRSGTPNSTQGNSSNADPHRGMSKAERKRLRRLQREDDDEEDTRAA